MKKIISTIVLSFLILGFSETFALRIVTKEEMQKQAERGEKIKARKLYHTFESKYIPNSKDIKLLVKIEKLLTKINKTNPTKLRKIYKLIDKKLAILGRKTRDANGKAVTKKNTRIYFLLEQINNKITDFEGNQDLGCAKNIAKAHMENNICVSNIKMIKNETGFGNMSYDYIFNHKWGNVIMTSCNTGYTKKETMENGYKKVLCVK